MDEERKAYPRFLKPNFKPFDPIKIAKLTEEIVCRGDERKYTYFYATGVYAGISTGYCVGCCLRCFYCWSNISRDFPEWYGEFYSAASAMKSIHKHAKSARVTKARISGGEPTLCREHLVKLLEEFEKTDLRLFILETNGILFGYDKSYVDELRRFERVHVRVSLKAGDPEAFMSRTGAIKSAFEYPFKAIEHLLESNVSFHVAAMTDPRIMPREERRALIERLEKIDVVVAANLEEEVVDPYDMTLIRLEAYGINATEFFKQTSRAYY